MLVAKALASAAFVASAAAAVVSIDPTPRQTLTSFGASGAWWPNDIENFPYDKQKQLADFLFSPNGVWLSSYRYNLGASGDNDTHYVFTPDKIIQSPMLTNGTYDWSRDAPGRRFLEYARNHSVPYITFFLNAAPSHIASNRQACGWTFTPNASEPFAQYIATVMSHYTDEGYNISYVSPMNEPDYLHPFCDQEGMNVPPQYRGYVFAAIKDALLKSSAKNVGVIGDETSQLGQTIGTWPQWLPNSSSLMTGLAIHNYDFPNDEGVSQFYQRVLNLTDNKPPPVKFTETCCAINAGNGPNVFGANYDPTMYNALVVARQVWQFLTIAQAESFDWWSAVSTLPCSPSIDGEQCATAYNATNGFNSALVYIDPNYNTTHDYNLYFVKRTYMMKHFAHFHRPGAIRYDIDHTNLPESVNAIASLSQADDEHWFAKNGIWNVMFMNNATTSQTFQFQFPNRADILLQIVETSPNVDWGFVPIIPNLLHFGSMKVTLPAQSIWTMRFVRGL